MGSISDSPNQQWLSRGREYEAKDMEWEQFYEVNKASVPSLLGEVQNLRQSMLNAKMRGQSKVAPITEGLVVEDHVIKSVEDGNLALRIYIPNGPDRPDSSYPTMIYFHGGGFALGDLDGEDKTCRFLCTKAAMVIVSVDYSLAPEHPYPAALNDAWDALKWVWCDSASDMSLEHHLRNTRLPNIKNATKIHVDRDQVFTGGTSAGANLAAVLAQGAKQKGIAIRGQLLRIPVLCQSDSHYTKLGLKSMREVQDTAILTPSAMQQFMQWYKPNDAAHVTVSPLLASRFDDHPPAYIQICGRDPLRDEGLAYADALQQASVPVRVNIYPGLPHAFWLFPEISTTEIAARDLVEGMKWLLGTRNE
ncbi:uncharacterized protein N7477_005267 [Penicillium maclennaniae]|uniref:uncharacterized protein n=1 Tax=Penicillium maclennaniae TaxID=1343394 RepID=UPI002541C8B5|nr:uncharacterized protein N7477_005267 [Penicillium maclennaniae]KAJ5669904.1 hypothetical protein N7477_005267 [Penicillium maclennaniae]